jgi:hypothetical protein
MAEPNSPRSRARSIFVRGRCGRVTRVPHARPSKQHVRRRSPLLQLPTELREQILEYVVTKPSDSQPLNLNNLHLPPAIVLTNHQLFREACSLFFKRNGFSIDVLAGRKQDSSTEGDAEIVRGAEQATAMERMLSRAYAAAAQQNGNPLRPPGMILAERKEEVKPRTLRFNAVPGEGSWVGTAAGAVEVRFRSFQFRLHVPLSASMGSVHAVTFTVRCLSPKESRERGCDVSFKEEPVYSQLAAAGEYNGWRVMRLRVELREMMSKLEHVGRRMGEVVEEGMRKEGGGRRWFGLNEVEGCVEVMKEVGW